MILLHTYVHIRTYPCILGSSRVLFVVCLCGGGGGGVKRILKTSLYFISLASKSSL